MGSRSPKGLLMAGGAIASLMIASPSWAQTAGAANNAPPKVEGLNEVVVTAQRRSENIQNVPISVNALTAAQLQTRGGTSSEDLTALVPAVVFNSGIGGGQITIRGIGGTNSGVDPGNAVYVDGVYQFSPQSNLFQINAIDRIEVLKGPQGTLFGRNAAGGLVHVITRDPSTKGPSGEMSVGYANYDTVSGNIYLNAPINDDLAVNFAAYGIDQRQGWGRNVITGNQDYLGYAWGYRAKLKWTAPDEKTGVLLAAYYNNDKPVGSDGSGTLPPGTFNIIGQGGVGLYNTRSNFDAFRTDQQLTLAATIFRDLGFARLTSITAYDSVKAPAYADGVLTPFPGLNARLFEKFHTVSQEVHLQSEEGGRLQWILGFLYLHDSNPGNFAFTFYPPFSPTGGMFTATTYSHVTTESFAGFGQATYAITDDTKITGGLRYTYDNAQLISSGAPPARATAGKPTWRLALDHKFSPNVLGYASYSRGFKSGLFNGTDPAHASAGPETLDAYEVGFKTETFNHRLRVNAALFYYSFQSIQIQLFENNVAFITNAGDAQSYGLDMDAAAEPIDNLTLTAGLSLINTRFTSSKPGTTCYDPLSQADAAGMGASAAARSCSFVGHQLPFAPKTTASFGASYKVPSQVGDFVFAGDYSYNSGYFNDPSNFAPAHTPAVGMLNLAVTWTSTSGRFNATVWGKNLLNKQVISGCNLAAGIGNTSFCYPLAPLTFGARVGVKF